MDNNSVMALYISYFTKKPKAREIERIEFTIRSENWFMVNHPQGSSVARTFYGFDTSCLLGCRISSTSLNKGQESLQLSEGS